MKNITENKKAGTFTVQTANGKTRTFKTRRGAENHARKNIINIEVPQIVTANTYFWSPNGSASGRRSAERRREAEIENFSIQLSVIPTVRVSGSYRETCSTVYKSMEYQVCKNGEWKNTNLTGLISECARWGLILTKWVETGFCPSAGLATGTDETAKQLENIMENFFEQNEIDNMGEIVNQLFTESTSKADHADEIHSIPAFRLLQLGY
jgi:hypothetical protein